MTARDESDDTHDEQENVQQSGQARYPRNIVASVSTRLLTRARDNREEFQLVLMRYALERLLYRLGQSEHAGDFIVKGAMLFSLWDERAHRATHDLDLLSYGTNDVPRLELVFRNLCRQAVEDDGLIFREETVQGRPIREDQEYGGVHIRLLALLGKAQIPLQIDIGFGDVVTPAPLLLSFPTLLDLPSPHVRTYPPETVIAEKSHALVQLGMANTRMKDFYDLWYLARHFPFDGLLISDALSATFARRETPVPATVPLALTPTFADDSIKQAQWSAFLRKSRLGADASLILPEVIALLREFLTPLLRAAYEKNRFASSWPAGGPWGAEETAHQ